MKALWYEDPDPGHNRCPVFPNGLTSIPARINNYVHYTRCDGITYPFPNGKWISNFIQHVTGYVITSLCRGLSWSMLVKWNPCKWYWIIYPGMWRFSARNNMRQRQQIANFHLLFIRNLARNVAHIKRYIGNPENTQLIHKKLPIPRIFLKCILLSIL